MRYSVISKYVYCMTIDYVKWRFSHINVGLSINLNHMFQWLLFLFSLFHFDVTYRHHVFSTFGQVRVKQFHCKKKNLGLLQSNMFSNNCVFLINHYFFCVLKTRKVTKTVEEIQSSIGRLQASAGVSVADEKTCSAKGFWGDVCLDIAIPNLHKHRVRLKKVYLKHQKVMFCFVHICNVTHL